MSDAYPDQDRDRTAGIWFALAAYSFWGVAPIYFRWVEFADPLEILAHRIVWSLLFLFVLVSVRRRWKAVVGLRRSDLAWLALSSVLLAINWLVFVWALQNGRIVETSLGYYINPLVSVLLGMVFLGERLRAAQVFALGLAASGVVFELVQVGVLPWAGLALAFSFGFYGLVRKKILIDSAVGLGVETAWLWPVAVIYLLISDNPSRDTEQLGLLSLGGLVTIFPLVCFAAAAMRLPLVTLGFFQYLAPTVTLLVAAFYYDQPMQPHQWITFGLIWCALLVFSVDGLRKRGT